MAAGCDPAPRIRRDRIRGSEPGKSTGSPRLARPTDDEVAQGSDGLCTVKPWHPSADTLRLRRLGSGHLKRRARRALLHTRVSAPVFLAS